MSNTNPCYVCTGKLGDILNVLPICKLDADAGLSPSLLVAKEFAGILDGVSYVNPVVFDGHWMMLKEAIAQARGSFSNVKVAQVAGPKKEVLEEAYKAVGLKVGDLNAESFAKDQWRVVGRFQDIKLNAPLVFDRRDEAREKKLLEGLDLRNDKRIILFYGAGTSSPYPYPNLLDCFIRSLLPARHYTVLDLATIKADRFYDLLALYERAYALISIDSAPLHLANATPNLPVVALTQDTPKYWHGSFWRKNWIATIRYRDPDNLPVISERLKEWMISPRFHRKPQGKAFVHVYSLYFVQDELHVKARGNWRRSVINYSDVIQIPIDRGTYGRDSCTVFNDKDRLPFVKDVIRSACFGRSLEDVIILTRPEASLDPAIFKKLETFPVCGARVIKDRANYPGTVHSATDLFAFTVGWWRDNQQEYPDMVMGGDPYWHRVLAELVALKGGERRIDLCYRSAGAGVPGNKDAGWRQWNAKAMSEFLKRHGISDDLPPVAKQVKSRQVNPVALYKNGYNPTITPLKDRLFMCYRSHRWDNAKTCLAFATLTPDLEVRNNGWAELEPETVSTEDGRFFWHKGELYMSYVVSNFPNVPMKSYVVYGKVGMTEGKVTIEYRHRLTPPFPREIEKNWVFFSHHDRIYVLYSADPNQECWEVDEDRIERIWTRPGVSWPWGTIRGGTQPMEIDGRWIRLFHSATYTEAPPIPWRYYVGAMEVRPEPPFDCIKVASKPIFGGSRDADNDSERRAFHFKPNIVFPGNWWRDGDLFRVAIGVNDVACHVVTLTKEQLLI